MAVDARREETTTTVVRLWVPTPLNWNGLSHVWFHARRELNEDLGRDLEATPADNEIWYEPGDDEIAVCFEKTTRREASV